MLAALCGPASLQAVLNGSLLGGLLLAGAAGSVVHCVPMCGPFVIGQVSDRLASVPIVRLCESHRIRGGLLLPYHAGRLSTYAALGALAALTGAGLARLPWLGRLSGVLLLLGALLFAAEVLRSSLPKLRPLLPATASAGWGRALRRCVRPIDRSRPSGGFLLGVVLGFLPCGLLYSALAVAAAAGTPWGGAMRMLAFGLGTVPSLIALGISGHALGRASRRALASVGPAVMLVNAVVLAALGLFRLAA